MAQESDLHQLVTEVRLIRAEMQHVAVQNEKYQDSLIEIFDRLRQIENTIAILHAQKQPRVNGWTIAAVLVASLMALISFVENVTLVG